MWRSYCTKRGSLNVGRRVEFSVGLLSYIKAQSLSEEKLDIGRFMPFEVESKSDEIDESEEEMWERMIDERWE